MKGLFLSVGLFLWISSGHAHVQTHEKSHAQTKVQSCDMVDAYDDHLHERYNVSEQGIEIQGMIEACQQSVLENPNNPYFLNNIGISQHKSGNFKEAED